MGNCVSGPPEPPSTLPFPQLSAAQLADGGSQQPPSCGKCGVQGVPTLGKMSSMPRGLTLHSNGLHYCRYCIKDRKEERKRFEKEWQFFREAKEVLFPRVQSRPALRSIQSGRRWEGTESFKESLESFKGSSVASGDSK